MLLPGSAFSRQLQPHWTSCPDHPSHIHTVTNAFGNHMRSAWKVIFESYYSAIVHSKISRCTLLVLKHHQYSQNLGQLKEHLKGVKQIAGCLWEISAKCKCLLVTLDGCFHMPTGPCFHTQQQKISSKGKWCQDVYPACLLWERPEAHAKKPSSSSQADEASLQWPAGTIGQPNYLYHSLTTYHHQNFNPKFEEWEICCNHKLTCWPPSLTHASPEYESNPIPCKPPEELKRSKENMEIPLQVPN
jgi:hypothetical protein